MARHLVEDFPRAKFIHTVRDPISSCERDVPLYFTFLSRTWSTNLQPGPLYGALFVWPIKICLIPGWNRGRGPYASKICTADAAQTMRDLADWLGLPYQATLLDSTFNGIPYVVKRDGKAWSGRRLEQAQRHSRNLSRKDRALLFAFSMKTSWTGTIPVQRSLEIRLSVRRVCFAPSFPTKMEIIAARAVFKPGSCRRCGTETSRAIKSLLAIVLCRLKIIRLLTSVFFGRCVSGAALLKVGQKSRPMDRGQDGARAARSET